MHISSFILVMNKFDNWTILICSSNSADNSAIKFISSVNSAMLCVYSSCRHWVNLQVSSEKWPSWDLTTYILIIAQLPTTLLNANMPWKSAKRSISLFYLVPYVLLTVTAQILVVPNNNNNNNNNEYLYRIALQCKSTACYQRGPCSLFLVVPSNLSKFCQD